MEGDGWSPSLSDSLTHLTARMAEGAPDRNIKELDNNLDIPDEVLTGCR